VPGIDNPLTGLGLSAAARALRDGDVTAERYAGALLSACRERGALNAFITLDPATVMAAARAADQHRRAGRPLGPLHGVPLAIKDNIDVRGYPTTGGTKALAMFRGARHASVVTRLAKAGALVLGKTNLHELSMGWTSNNAAFGPVRHFIDRDRIAGGSSGGTAVAVASGMAPAGLGTDTNGSLRIPSSFCGITCLRPSVGRYPMAGVMPLSRTLDTIGPMARSVADLALLDGVLAGHGFARAIPSLDGVRLGLARAYFLQGASPPIVAVVEEALRRLEENGAEIVELDLPALDDTVPTLVPTILHYEAAQQLPRYLARLTPAIGLREVAAEAGPDVLGIIEGRLMPDGVDRVPRQVYRRAMAARARLATAVQRRFEADRLSALIYPTARISAPFLSSALVSPAPDPSLPDGTISARDAYGRNVAMASLLGLPSLVLPAGVTRDALPVSIEFAARPGADEALLGLGFALEAALAPAGHMTPAATPQENQGGDDDLDDAGATDRRAVDVERRPQGNSSGLRGDRL
jgi:mandelamide amidase